MLDYMIYLRSMLCNYRIFTKVFVECLYGFSLHNVGVAELTVAVGLTVAGHHPDESHCVEQY